MKPLGYWLLAGVAVMVLAFWAYPDHAPIVSSTEVKATVLSVATGDGPASYYLEMQDGKTQIVSGPTLPLYPKGTTVTLLREERRDGAVELSFKP